MVYFVDADESCRELKHVVAQRNDNELGILCPFLDVARNDGDLYAQREKREKKSVADF